MDARETERETEIERERERESIIEMTANDHATRQAYCPAVCF